MLRRNGFSIKRLLLKVLLMLLIPLVFMTQTKGPNGNPLLDFSYLDIKQYFIKQKIQLAQVIELRTVKTQQLFLGLVKTKSEAEKEKVLVYRWQDELGQWHFSQWPPQHIPAGTIEIVDKALHFAKPEHNLDMFSDLQRHKL